MFLFYLCFAFFISSTVFSSFSSSFSFALRKIGCKKDYLEIKICTKKANRMVNRSFVVLFLCKKKNRKIEWKMSCSFCSFLLTELTMNKQKMKKNKHQKKNRNKRQTQYYKMTNRRTFPNDFDEKKTFFFLFDAHSQLILLVHGRFMLFSVRLKL